MALGGIDPRVEAIDYLDALWAIIVDAPVDHLIKLQDRMTVEVARADPERAREDWGARPEHQRASSGLMKAGPAGAK